MVVATCNVRVVSEPGLGAILLLTMEVASISATLMCGSNQKGRIAKKIKTTDLTSNDLSHPCIDV